MALNGGAEIMVFGGIRPKEFMYDWLEFCWNFRNYPRVYILDTTPKAQLEEEDPKQKERWFKFISSTFRFNSYELLSKASYAILGSYFLFYDLA